MTPDIRPNRPIPCNTLPTKPGTFAVGRLCDEWNEVSLRRGTMKVPRIRMMTAAATIREPAIIASTEAVFEYAAFCCVILDHRE